VIVSKILFWLFVIPIFIPFIPIRFLLFLYLIIVHFDSSGGVFASASTLGIENAVKVVLLPSLLLLRSFSYNLKMAKFIPGIAVWILLCIYVIISSSWSPFQLSAIKQIGYLYAYFAIILVAARCYTDDQQKTYRLVSWSIAIVFLLAILQTFFLNNVFGGDDNRFTSFSSPQGFALYLVVMLSIVISFSSVRTVGALPKQIIIPLIAVAIILNGSRTGLVTAGILLILSIIWWSKKTDTSVRNLIIGTTMFIVVALCCIGVVLVVATDYSVTKKLQNSRSTQVINVLIGNSSLEDISTAAWRIQIYISIIEKIRYRDLKGNLLGAGTSSVAEIVTGKDQWYRGYSKENVDANRIAHNEFLRSLYEWGIIGLTLVFGLLIIHYKTIRTLSISLQSFESYSFFSILIVLLVMFSSQNLFAAAGTPLGSGIALFLGRLTSLKFKLKNAIELN
jgi:hypothetical protein